MINIRGDEEMEENQEQNDSKEYLEMVKRLDEIQKQLKILEDKLFQKEGKLQIGQKVTNMKDKIMKQAAVLGQKVEKIQEIYKLNKDTKDNILQQYKDSLGEIDNHYGNLYQAILRQKAKNQEQEQVTMLKEHQLKKSRRKIKKSTEYAKHRQQEKALANEIKKALDKGDLDTVTVKNEELKHLKSKNPLALCDKEIEKTKQQRLYIQQLINRCDQELEDAKIERESSIEQAIQDKDNQLATVKKQSLFKRVVGAIKNKINGAKMFRDNVIGKLAEKMGYIKQETIPQVERVTSEKVAYIDEYHTKNRQKVVGRDSETREELIQIEENESKANQERETEQSTMEVQDDREVG